MDKFLLEKDGQIDFYNRFLMRVNPALSLEEILAGKVDFPYKEARPLQLFASYLREGYYPFFKEGNYTMRLNGIIKQVVEDDVPKFADMEIASVQKLKKLLYILAQNVPFKPNYAKLERDLGISRNTLPKYMQYLEKAGLIGVLREKVQGIKLLEKIEKIYLNNPNHLVLITSHPSPLGAYKGFIGSGVFKKTIEYLDESIDFWRVKWEKN